MEVDQENFDQIVRVNTWGVIVCTQEAAKQMIAQGSGGKIINTGSIASRQGFWDFVPYCVAKFGTLAVTQATARGLIEYGITVNSFASGVVDTPMWDEVDALFAKYEGLPPGEKKRRVGEGVPYGRMGKPEDHVGCAVFLASPESDYVVAQTFNVDGGQWMS